MRPTSNRQTKTSLLRQSKIRSSLRSAPFVYQKSLKQITNMYSSKQEGENDPVSMSNVEEQQQKKTGNGVMKNVVFKRRSVKKLAAILSGSSLDNSTKESDTLKQVIVSSLTETVQKLEIAVDDQENKPSGQQKVLKPQRVIPPPKPRAVIVREPSAAIAVVIKQLEIVTIEPSFARDNDFDIDELDEDEYRVNGEIYVMNYVRDIMN
ncbi:unnamed protein product, partial [Didymodactylos carnosus]